MDPVRRIARPLLASIFVSGGIEALRNRGPEVAVGGDVATDVADALPVDLPDDPETLVKLDAAVKVVGGLVLASGGRFARFGALACAASLVPTTFAAHRFWEIDDPDERTKQQIHFFKNLSMLGGLLIAATDTGGRPSVPWLAGRAAGGLRERTADLLPG